MLFSEYLCRFLHLSFLIMLLLRFSRFLLLLTLCQSKIPIRIQINVFPPYVSFFSINEPRSLEVRVYLICCLIHPKSYCNLCIPSKSVIYEINLRLYIHHMFQIYFLFDWFNCFCSIQICEFKLYSSVFLINWRAYRRLRQTVDIRLKIYLASLTNGHCFLKFFKFGIYINNRVSTWVRTRVRFLMNTSLFREKPWNRCDFASKAFEIRFFCLLVK